MKKERGDLARILALVLFTIILASFASASFSVGNPAGKIDKSYSYGDVLSGWINISLDNQPSDSKIEAFDSSMNLVDFLDENSVSYTCIPSNCEQAYSAINERTSASFSLTQSSSKLLAFELTGDFSLVDDISFSLSTNAKESCSTPLKIDFLDDKTIDWQYSEAGTDFCQANYGCFNFSSNPQEFMITTQQYCEKITLTPVSKFRIGAYIKKTSGTSALTMSMYDSEKELLSSCSLPASDITSTFKEVYCDVNVSLSNQQDGYVCIGTASGTGYAIQGETSGKNCGYYSIYSTSSNADYRIFAKPSKYKQATDTIQITNQTTSSIFLDIENYIADEYSNDCSSGCVIPFRVLSNTKQDISLSNLNFKIITSSGIVVSNKFYDISSDKARITMPFKVLDLKKANLKVPSDTNVTSVTIYFDNDEILSSNNITIRRVASINNIYPLKVPVNFPTNFIAQVTEVPGDAIKNYEWDFNGEVKTTKTNAIFHTFSSTGNYSLKLKITTNSGIAKTKTFNVIVASAKDAINYTINLKKQKIKDFKVELASFPLKSTISKELNLEGTEKKLDELYLKYQVANTESEYTSIMAELSSQKVPLSIRETFSLTGELIPDFNSLSAEEIGQASSNSSAELENLYSSDSAQSWYLSNIDTSLIGKKYTLNYDDNTAKIVASFFNINIQLNNNAPVHVLIKKSLEALEFSQNYNQEQKGSNTIIDLTSDSQLEFTILGNYDDKDIYIFPDLSNLIAEISPCNFNDKCEAEIGETKQNCRQDCHSNLLTFFLLILILFAAFIGYLLLQQWYRIRYETFLFKDRNYLFNLLNFINNAQKQKLTEQQIKNKLKKEGWTNEQIIYALKKYKGKETGMFDFFKLLRNFGNLKNLKVNPKIQQTPKSSETFITSKKLSKK